MSIPNIKTVVISHGYQQDYERGFVNGLALNGVAVTLIGSDATDVTRLHPAVNMLNLRGSQAPSRSRCNKLLNLVRYHLRLLLYIAVHQPATIHFIGLYRGGIFSYIIEPVFMRMHGRHVVETVHNLLPHQRHTKWNHWVHWLIYRVPNVLVVHTEKMKCGLVKKFGISRESIIVMQHGVNDTLVDDSVSATVVRSITSESPIKMLCFGAVSRYKGHDLLIEAMDSLDEGFELLIAGICVDVEYQTILEEEISGNRNRERIAWRPGFVPDADVTQLFHDADVAILPYYHIDQSGVLFKSLGLGCPVIATDVGSFRDYITPETGIITEAISAEALRDACLTFRSRRNQYDRDTIRSFASRFLWSKTVYPVISSYL